MSDEFAIMQKVLEGYTITKSDAFKLLELPPDTLLKQANIIRKHFCGSVFDACSIINVKSGKCSENCKFCAQSEHYKTGIDVYPLLSRDELIEKTLQLYNHGIKRISYVSSGRKVSDDEFNTIIKVIDYLKNSYKDLNICVSLGLLSTEQIVMLNDNGADRLHCNLETSEKYFSSICSTHSFDEKVNLLNNICNHNINSCCGGIFGLGESFEDRIDLALTLRKHNVKSIPVNILNPIKGTPLENRKILSNDEVCTIVALIRFINPDSFIRLAGGRGLLPDNGKRAFTSGANSAILGDMLTTRGVKFDEDCKMIEELGYKITYR